jgi:putative Holliday junction resolvase
MRILALDVGERRIGVAVADDKTGVAVPLPPIEPGGDPLGAGASLVGEQAAGRLIVGLPLSLNGSLGPQGQRVQAFADALAARLSLPVETWDERLTSVEANRRLRPYGRRSRGKSRERAKAAVDALAAAIILQAYLDSRPRRSGQSAGGGSASG